MITFKIGDRVNALFYGSMERNGVIVAFCAYMIQIQCDSGELLWTPGNMVQPERKVS